MRSIKHTQQTRLCLATDKRSGRVEGFAPPALPYKLRRVLMSLVWDGPEQLSVVVVVYYRARSNPSKGRSWKCVAGNCIGRTVWTDRAGTPPSHGCFHPFRRCSTEDSQRKRKETHTHTPVPPVSQLHGFVPRRSIRALIFTTNWGKSVSSRLLSVFSILLAVHTSREVPIGPYYV